MKRFFLICFAVALGLIGCFLLKEFGFQDTSREFGFQDTSIEPLETRHTNGGATVENGKAYDKASLDIKSYKTLVVPENAQVRIEGAGPRLQIFMEKTLSFGGHPAESMSVRTERREMGCAFKMEEATMVLATFGEWSSKEGGAHMRLVLVAPPGWEIEKRAKLSGSDSAAKDQHSGKQAAGWNAVPDAPDLERNAKE